MILSNTSGAFQGIDGIPRWECWWTKLIIQTRMFYRDKSRDAYSRNLKVHSQSWKHGWKVIKLWRDVILMKDTSSGSWLELARVELHHTRALHQSRCQPPDECQQRLRPWHLSGTGQWAVELWRHATCLEELGCGVMKTCKVCILYHWEKKLWNFTRRMKWDSYNTFSKDV